MDYYIRQASANDGHEVSHLIYDAIGEIAHRLTGENTKIKVLEKLTELFKRTDNRHSYLNTYVAEHKTTNQILGIVVLYSGRDGVIFDKNLQNWLTEKNAAVPFIDSEAHLDEFYIDTLCIHKDARGKGIGTKLLQYAVEVGKSKGFTKLSLNVDIEKTNAKSLYERLGFTITEPWTIIDEPFHHMVKIIK